MAVKFPARQAANEEIARTYAYVLAGLLGLFIASNFARNLANKSTCSTKALAAIRPIVYLSRYTTACF